MDKQAMAEQVQRTKIANMRAKAEQDILKAMLPDKVLTDYHYDGKRKAIYSNPEYKEVIELLFT